MTRDNCTIKFEHYKNVLFEPQVLRGSSSKHKLPDDFTTLVW